MSPEFAAAFDPALVEILALAERARGGTAGPPTEEQAGVRAALDRGASRMPGTRAKDWELASFALAALADDLLAVDIAWPGQQWWENNAVEFGMFHSRNRATWFFDRAEEASGLASRDALEAFILAVVLGFKGMFRDRPDALTAWLRRQEPLVKVGQGRPTLPDAGPELSGAPPLSGSTRLIWASLTTAFALACAVVTAGAVMGWGGG
jgi:type VI protein secretion system component VasF